MDALLDAVENETLGSEQDAIEFFEKKYKEITSVRKKLNKRRPRVIEQPERMETFLEESEPLESQFRGKWYLNEKDAKRFFKEVDDKIGRYPEGWRHYETFVTFKAMHKDATMDDYVQEMNRQVEYEEFLTILKTATVEEANSPLYKHKMSRVARKKNWKVEDYITTEAFYEQAKHMYEGAT